jgi:hypothetical protein
MQDILYSSEPIVSSSAKAALLAKKRASTMASPAIAITLVVDVGFCMTPSFDTLFAVIKLPQFKYWP